MSPQYTRRRLGTSVSATYNSVRDQLNFYRVHVLCFTFFPLIMSSIMFGVSTAYKISFIDCLFCCISAMTVTGLATVNLSTLSALQQAILFVHMICGSVTFVSIIMVYTRLHAFRQKFKHVIEERRQMDAERAKSSGFPRTLSRVGMKDLARKLSGGFRTDTKEQSSVEADTELDPKLGAEDLYAHPTSSQTSRLGQSSQFSPANVDTLHQVAKSRSGTTIDKSMISRVEGGGVGMMSPMGRYQARSGSMEGKGDPLLNLNTDPISDMSPSKTPYSNKAVDENTFPRVKTIAFEEENHAFPNIREAKDSTMRSTNANSEGPSRYPTIQTDTSHSGFPRTYSLRPSETRTKVESRLSGFGGFPTPWEFARDLFEKAFPERANRLRRTMSMAQTTTVGRGETEKEQNKDTPYISFSAVVGRNSQFEGLTEAQMEELGGVEYRALRVLLWIVIGIACFVIFTPYLMAGGRYDAVFDAQFQLVPIPWFSLFQAVSALTNTGMSLSDTSLIPFQDAYLLIALNIILIFAGYTAYPVFLRLTVWSIYRMTPKTSRVRESLKFLLDHPRRCFVYMFPSHQTWVLACVMTILYLIDFVSFLVLDIGTESIESIPVGKRIAASFLQSAAVRNAGFAIVSLSALAPAVKVLYIAMMYISVYPIALSVRATNVYEEKSLGLYGDEDAKDGDDAYDGKGAYAVAKYVGWHARRQLAFDIWWLALALWVICIIERGNIVNVENDSYFNIFSVLFEVVSAYGTVGLSLGVPYDNYSFSGAWSTLSKLVICLVMLRGRHRGLPVAIDRAVMLPRDFTVEDEEILERARSRRLSRQASALSGNHGSGAVS